MKRVSYVFIALFLCACSVSEESSNTNTYEYKQQKEREEQILPSSYQMTVDESFELVSKYEGGHSGGHLFFWHEPSASEYAFDLETTQEDLEKEVPTIEVKPLHKYANFILSEMGTDFLMEDATPKETEQKMREKIEENSEEYFQNLIEREIERAGPDTEVISGEELDIAPYEVMLQNEDEAGVTRFHFIGETEEDYLVMTVSLPSLEDEELVDNMMTSIQSITYDEAEFKEQPVRDEPNRLSYEPAENLKGNYPEIGYSFERPEAAVFRHSFPVYHTYRYTFGTKYEESIEKEHFTLYASDLVIRAAKEENARNREGELRERELEDFVPYQHDYARSITYLHEDEKIDTGVFTTAVMVEFDGYEEYWFLTEMDGHVFEVTFNIAPEASEYEELLDSYFNVITSFEIK